MVGVSTKLREDALTNQDPESSYQISGPGLFDFKIGKFEDSVPGTND